ncbi:MAG: DUF1622 domain-containing protein [Acidobacteria bacterium]|jgi:uncharacterized membrane protein|nr:DUF1622 domain-containing protein [Acidobacteriota bacterium]
MFWQGNLENIAQNGAYQSVEQTIVAAAQWLKLGIETVGALIICLGVILAIYQLTVHFLREQSSNFNYVRLTLGKYLVLALEFQVGADILSTAIAPSWEQVGKLGAIAAIRTVLNYFLTRELAAEQKREPAGRTENEQNTEI